MTSVPGCSCAETSAPDLIGRVTWCWAHHEISRRGEDLGSSQRGDAARPDRTSSARANGHHYLGEWHSALFDGGRAPSRPGRLRLGTHAFLFPTRGQPVDLVKAGGDHVLVLSALVDDSSGLVTPTAHIMAACTPADYHSAGWQQVIVAQTG